MQKNLLITQNIENQVIFNDNDLSNGVHLAIQGGGIRSTVGLGVLKALEEYNIPVVSVSGTSLGSIAASFIACGLKADDILKIFLQYNSILTDAGITGSGKGNSEVIEKEVNKEIKKIFYPDIDDEKIDFIPDITFKDTPIDLYINATNGNFIKSVIKAKEIVFSKETSPNLSIGAACRASARLPIFFNNYKTTYEGIKLKPLDGGMVFNPALPSIINRPIILSTFDKDKAKKVDKLMHIALKNPIDKSRRKSYTMGLEISPDLRSIGITGSNDDMIIAFNKGYNETIRELQTMNIAQSKVNKI